MPAPERIPPRSLTALDARDLLAEGELTVRGRVREASNAVLYCSVAYEGEEATASTSRSPGSGRCGTSPTGRSPSARSPRTRSPRRPAGAWCRRPCCGTGRTARAWSSCGSRPDPSDGSLLALVEDEEPGEGWKAVGFAEVGEGRTALLVHADDVRLRRLAVLDAVINNGDRKGGHLLPTADGRLYAHRPRRHVQRGRQAADPAVGLGGGAADRRGAGGAAPGWPAALADGAPLGHPAGGTDHRRRDRGAAGAGGGAAADRAAPGAAGRVAGDPLAAGLSVPPSRTGGSAEPAWDARSPACADRAAAGRTRPDPQASANRPVAGSGSYPERASG